MKKKYGLAAFIVFFIIAFDQWTKLLVLEHFALGESKILIHDLFSLTYVRNPGAAFGLLNTWDPVYRIPFFVAIPLLALSVIFSIFRKLDDKDFFMVTALSLVMGGAIGNLIDRVRFNYVVDFLDFYWKEGGPHFPAFNVADSAITVGVSLMVIDLLMKEKKTHAAGIV
jgi:signal peptidase II